LEQLGKYEVVRRLAVGGMAELYLASSSGPKGFKRSLVIKKLLPDLASDPSFVEMFLSEARIAGELNHPNIVHVHEVGEGEGDYFIVMEYVDGPNLRTLASAARKAGQPISPYLAAKVVSIACDGLGYAHELRDTESGEPLRIVHRDMSPDNIIIARTGAVKVVDFGIAKVAWQHQRTATGIVKGKLAYMAPEQMAQQAVDHRADIYSLGVVLYELLSGRRPHEAEDDIGIMQAVLRGEPAVPLADHCPDLPGELLDIVDKALAPAPADRYQSCSGLQSDLERFLHGAERVVGSQDLAKLVADLQAEPAWGRVAVTPAAASSRSKTEPAGSKASVTAVARRSATPTDAERVPASEEVTRRALPKAPWKGIAVAGVGFLLAGTAVLVFTRQVTGPAAPVPPPRPAAPAPAPVVPAAAAQPDPPPPPAPAAQVPSGIVTVTSRPPATVRIAGLKGRTPFTAEVEPGDVKIELSDPGKGIYGVLWAVETIKVGPGEQVPVEVKFYQVKFRSVPESKVFVDGHPLRDLGPDGDLTPIKALLTEGEHKVLFQCTSGREDRQTLRVRPSADELVVDGKCARR
jgi:serine/threonine-protein kinase